ncbi:glycerol-3-phosphate 1-O-acyltransferase [Gordonia polyisoprenivorans]|uniref:glycerol-3-phosphate 1-O-acyltransferase n=1 Tax=Gordonia polyisoprenivorans TaxID=84595 RepID=UPI001AD7398F|nr:glycerol-3-phosphate 1-O-acyltransferase [Gordonia polyisoprenivorans]QTI67685.1 glycerol-3-phosphate 1-O-acyltransferase [Gordonia polyisoprenivorans]
MTDIVLAEVGTPCERQVVAEWAQTAHPDALLRTLDEIDAETLQPETALIPARVVWLPPVRKGERRVSVADVLVLSNPRRPPAFRQNAIKKRRPDRVRVAVGEAATVADLRARHEQSSAEGEAFTAFVGVQAALSAERAERQIVGDRYKVPRLVAEQIGSSARFRDNAAKLAADLGRPVAAVVTEATDKMSAFVATQSRLMDDVFSSTFRALYERAWTVSVDLDTLGRLRTLNKSHGLIFLPSHRSYVDTLVLSEVLRSHDFPPNLVLGGNNLAIWPIAPVARRAGVIFIRRKFGGDPVYKFAMRSYLSFIVDKRFNLEWYIEGGRSRTGKLRPPKLGLLSYVVDAIEQLDDADMMVVPTSIVYDQLHEIAAMARESAGGAKKPEDVTWLLKYAKAQRTHLGEARVRFGTPFSLREAIADGGDDPAALDKIAFGVMDEINAATPISATSLAGFALLGAGERAYTAGEIEEILEPLLDYIDRRGLPGPDAQLCRGLGLLSTLRELTTAGVLTRFDGGTDTVWSIAPGNHAVAAYYRNGALHHFVDRAIVEMALVAADRGDLEADVDAMLAASQQEALRIRDLLKFEFFFPTKEVFLHRLGAELDLIAPEWRETPPTPEWIHQTLLATSGALFARRTLQTFFDAQLVVAQRLVALDDAPIDKEQVLADCLGLGRQLELQAVIRSKDSVSTELYDAAFRLAENRHLISPAAESAVGIDLAGARRAWFDEVEEMRERLAKIAAIEAEQAGAAR